ncbi:hypothetical protein LX77_03886 [Gelidibacter algens]|uniref:Lipocalin-like protein n=1 Tax=Gelidibacter algens TaxID=49280 RepID=A0A327RP06_9FLAO|nr:hypothetical protein [Gelidibacter algens]RAJ17364.1 hypothetical protein LX77_03886 [Gelidibacter algens]
MKRKLIALILLFGCSSSIFGQAISKNELNTVLKETLAKSRNFVSDATNSWYYDNSENDYDRKDTITLKTARSFKRDYCNIINWTFYEWNHFRLEVADYCNEPPTKLASKNEDYFELLIDETDDKTILLLKNINGVQDQFEIVESLKNTPIDNGNDQFNYTIKLRRIK